jgi:hypothetical protein
MQAATGGNQMQAAPGANQLQDAHATRAKDEG